MLQAVMISAGIAVVALVLLALLRGRKVARQPMRRSQVAVVVGLAVLIAAGVDYYVVSRPGKSVKAGGASSQGGMGGGGMGPGMGMMGGGMGGGMGGAREPSPKRDLGRFVRKLALFQGKGEGGLDAKQAAVMLPILTGLQSVEKMTEEEGKAQLAAARAVLTEAQLAAVDAIELPRPPGGMGGPGGGMGGPGGGMGGPAASPPAAAAEGAPAAPAPGRGQASRERLLKTPYVKQQYDAKVAADSTFAQDEGKQREFFGAVVRELSPFQQAPSMEALAGLVKALQDGGGKPQAQGAP